MVGAEGNARRRHWPDHQNAFSTRCLLDVHSYLRLAEWFRSSDLLGSFVGTLDASYVLIFIP